MSNREGIQAMHSQHARSSVSVMPSANGEAPMTPAPVYGRAPMALPITPAPDSRPVIRPPVASPMSATSVSSSARRATPVPATALATAHLGIEESEYDKPTYLRRALAGYSMRLPGDGKA